MIRKTTVRRHKRSKPRGGTTVVRRHKRIVYNSPQILGSYSTIAELPAIMNSRRRIENVGQMFGVDLRRGESPIIVIVPDGDISLGQLAARYDSDEDTIYIQRQFIIDNPHRKILDHEMAHAYSGEHLYLQGTMYDGTSVSVTLEEGTSEFIARNASQEVMQAKDKAYNEEFESVEKLTEIIGEKKYFRYWHKGFSNTYLDLANDLDSANYPETAKRIRENYKTTEHADLVYIIEKEEDKEERRLYALRD